MPALSSGGADSRTRTDTLNRASDFKSEAAAITPYPHIKQERASSLLYGYFRIASYLGTELKYD